MSLRQKQPAPAAPPPLTQSLHGHSLDHGASPGRRGPRGTERTPGEPRWQCLRGFIEPPTAANVGCNDDAAQKALRPGESGRPARIPATRSLLATSAPSQLLVEAAARAPWATGFGTASARGCRRRIRCCWTRSRSWERRSSRSRARRSRACAGRTSPRWCPSARRSSAASAGATTSTRASRGRRGARRRTASCSRATSSTAPCGRRLRRGCRGAPTTGAKTSGTS